MRVFRELAEMDPPAVAALLAAGAVSELGNTDRDYGNILWPLLEPAETSDREHEGEVEAALHHVLAPFVRAHPDAPAEALFRAAASAGVHREDPARWPALSLGHRAAYTTFREVLLLADRLTAEEKAREASQHPQIPAASFRPVDVEDTMLAKTRSTLDLDPALAGDVGRPMVIIPGTGLPPGHVPERRADPPPIESNIERDGLRVVRESDLGPDGSDRRGHGGAPPAEPPPIAGAPAIGGSIAPGGAVGQADDGSHPLGHGFDPTIPFNPEGNAAAAAAPAPVEPRSPQTPAVAAPGETALNAPPVAPEAERPGLAPAGETEALPIETRHVQGEEERVAALSPGGEDASAGAMAGMAPEGAATAPEPAGEPLGDQPAPAAAPDAAAEAEGAGEAAPADDVSEAPAAEADKPKGKKRKGV